MKVRLLRGQVVVREIAWESSKTIWTPDPTQRQQTTHRGRVLEMGPPMLRCVVDKNGGCVLDGCPHNIEVPHYFKKGDVVVYHYTHHQDAHTRNWVDNEPASWVPQYNIDAVIE